MILTRTSRSWRNSRHYQAHSRLPASVRRSSRCVSTVSRRPLVWAWPDHHVWLRWLGLTPILRPCDLLLQVPSIKRVSSNGQLGIDNRVLRCKGVRCADSGLWTGSCFRFSLTCVRKVCNGNANACRVRSVYLFTICSSQLLLGENVKRSALLTRPVIILPLAVS
jgi:hypothetical protein